MTTRAWLRREAWVRWAAVWHRLVAWDLTWSDDRRRVVTRQPVTACRQPPPEVGRSTGVWFWSVRREAPWIVDGGHRRRVCVRCLALPGGRR